MEFLTKAKLKESGWTEGAIKKFLGKPDKTKANPVFRSAAPMALYSSTRIRKLEESPAFLEWLAKRNSRKAGYAKAVATKKQKILATVSSWVIEVPEIKGLLPKAIQHFNDFKAYKEDYDSLASEESSPEFLNRISVNFVRHTLTPYDRQLTAIFGKVGVTEAYQLLNQKIYDQISLVYPHLATQCKEQLLRKFGEIETPQRPC